MNRSLLIAVFTLLSITASATPAPGRDAERPPNIVLIMADDLGAAELGSYGNTVHLTPNLDRLAAEGIRFQTCYATPVCSPTRVMIMTGRYGFRTGWYDFINRGVAPREGSAQFDIGSAETTFADLLKARGYATALAGKWQLPGRGETLIRDCGFDEYRIWSWLTPLPGGVQHTGRFENPRRTVPARFWHPCIIENDRYLPTGESDYGPDLFADFLIDFMRRNRDRPFVAYYPMVLTHAPWEETPDFERPGKRRPEGLKSNVEYADHLVGRIVAALEQLGLRQDTLVIFTGDNGTKDAGKQTVTEYGARVPLIVNWPGTTPAGVVSPELIDLSDMLPTFAELAGAPLPEGRAIDGHSFAPLLRGEEGFVGREWIFSFLGTERMLRDKRWLLEGDGRFFDCGENRDHEGYRDVTDSRAPEVLAARRRFEAILQGLPAPEPAFIHP